MRSVNSLIEPVGAQLVRHCYLVWRACTLAAGLINGDSDHPDAVAQIDRLRNQSIEAKHRIVESLLHRSFIDETYEETGRLAAAFDALMGSIARCAGALASSGAAGPGTAASTASNLLLRCVALMHDCTRRRNFDAERGGRPGEMAANFSNIHLVETELDRILRPAAATGDMLASTLC